MNAIFGMVRVVIDALFPPRQSEQLLDSLAQDAYERLYRPISRDGIDALLPYDHPSVRALIWELKYYESQKATDAAANLLCSYATELLAEELLDPPVLVAVPLHKKRMQERGYNQSERLAHAAARKLGAKVAYAPHLMIRHKNTARQTDLPRKKRLANVQNVFGVTRAHAIAGRTCILIDDVLTTGSTLSEASKTLRRAGASRVFPVAVAYAE